MLLHARDATPRRLGRSTHAAFLIFVVVCLAIAQGPEAWAATAPVIRGVKAIEVTQTTAKITWTVDRPATGRVQYGRSRTYGNWSTLESSFRYTTHVQLLRGLKPATTYHFRVRSRSRAGILAVSRDFTFKTDPLPGVVPTPAGIAVPSSIDATGATDASAALNAFLGTVPDGSTIVFKAGGRYRMDHGLKVRNRRNLVFEGNGATLSSNPATASIESDSLIALWRGNKGITIRNFHFVGNSDKPGVFTGRKEGVHAVLIQGDDVEIHDVTVRGMYGDAFHIHESGTETVWSNNIRIHDSRVYSTGRNGVTVIAGQNAIIERVAFDTIGYSTLDIEPNRSDQGARNIIFRNNTNGTWGNSFVSAEGAAGSIVNGVTITGNTITGDSMVTAIRLARRQNITITNNTARVATWGPALRLAYIDGLVVKGNVQPLTSGSFLRCVDCTAVDYVP